MIVYLFLSTKIGCEEEKKFSSKLVGTQANML